MGARSLENMEGLTCKGETFSVVVAYEDSGTGRRAVETYTHLVGRWGRKVRFQTRMWPFDALREPTQKEAAARQAADADMVIISTHGMEGLPDEVKQWIDLWTENPARAEQALVELIDEFAEEPPTCSATHAYLEGIAEKAKLEFFSRCYQVQEALRNLTPAQVTEREHRTSSVLDDILRRSYPPPRWGINE